MSEEKNNAPVIVPTQTQVEQTIVAIRGQRVILDAELAKLYGVETRSLNQAVKRNLDRFPEDFMFQLNEEEFKFLTSQIVISNDGRGGRRKLPYAFTEHGAIMAATILKSQRAAEASIYVVRAFVRMRQMIETSREFAHRLSELEIRFGGHDLKIDLIIDMIKSLMNPPKEDKDRIGFSPDS